MGLDVRLPIGAMFLIAGLLLAVYGLVTNGDAVLYQKSLSININLWWGIAMSVFGIVFLLLALRGKGSPPSTQPAESGEESRPIVH